MVTATNSSPSGGRPELVPEPRCAKMAARLASAAMTVSARMASSSLVLRGGARRRMCGHRTRHHVDGERQVDADADVPAQEKAGHRRQLGHHRERQGHDDAPGGRGESRGQERMMRSSRGRRRCATGRITGQIGPSMVRSPHNMGRIQGLVTLRALDAAAARRSLSRAASLEIKPADAEHISPRPARRSAQGDSAAHWLNDCSRSLNSRVMRAPPTEARGGGRRQRLSAHRRCSSRLDERTYGGISGGRRSTWP